jgi:DNA-binding LacI/PurR family transcriptional regulator
MPGDTGLHTGITAYASLAENLRRTIRAGSFQPGQLIASEYELARQGKVSRVTVRRASELLIKEGLVERRPGKGLFLRAQGMRRTNLIQVIAGNLQWEPCLRAGRAIQEAARASGVQVQVYDAHGNMDLDLDHIRRLPEGQAQGAVIIALHCRDFSEVLFELKLKGFPFVIVDQRLRDLDVPSVTADNHAGGLAAGGALVAAGHRRIAFIGDLIAGTVRERLAGLRDAMGDANLPFDRSLVMDLPVERDRFADWTPQIERVTRALMASPDAPTAIFCSCDAVARSAFRALAGLGLRVPDDVSVIGFDADPLSEYLAPSLTTVSQPFAEMGRVAFGLLQARIVDPHAMVEHRKLPVQLIERASISAPRAGAWAMP